MMQKKKSFDEWWEGKKQELSTTIDVTISKKEVEKETLMIMKELLGIIKVKPIMKEYNE